MLERRNGLEQLKTTAHNVLDIKFKPNTPYQNIAVGYFITKIKTPILTKLGIKLSGF